MSQQLILNWLNQFSESVKNHDLDSHMALVSKNVQVYGLPNQASVDYQGWKRRRRNEFSNKLLASLSYSDLTIKTITLRRLGFRIKETMFASSGKKLIIDKEMMLEQEDDGQWRIVEEKVVNWKPL